MLFGAAGSFGLVLLVFLLIGLGLQAAVGGLGAVGRRVPAAGAVAFPVVALAVGALGSVHGLGEAVDAVAATGDPAWMPWFALQDRARALAPAALGAATAAVLLLPAAIGAGVGGLRLTPRSWTRWVLVGGAVSIGTALVAGGAIRAGVGAEALGPALVLLGLGVAAAFTQLPAAPPRWTLPATGAACLVFGTVAAALWLFARGAVDTLEALPDFEAPFSRLGALDRSALTLERLPLALAPGLVVLGAGALAGLAGRSTDRLDRASAADAGLLLALGLMVAVSWASIPVRWVQLGHLAGDHAAGVLRERPGYDVPHRAVVPPRVLIADPRRPRWLAVRDGGGLARDELIPGLEPAFRELRTGDGLVLPPSLPVDELYFALAEADVGELGVVGCAEVASETWLAIRWDPLRAVGRCGAFPVKLRATAELRDPRVLIVLKDREVDVGGDVVPLRELPDLRGRAVVLRAQVDATADDWVAALRELADAGPVYLGWGVQLDGEDLPVGVRPGLQARPASPNGGEAAPTSPS